MLDHGLLCGLRVTSLDGLQDGNMLKGRFIIMMFCRVFSMSHAGPVPQFQQIIGQLVIVRRLPDGLVNGLIERHIFRNVQRIQMIPQIKQSFKQFVQIFFFHTGFRCFPRRFRFQQDSHFKNIPDELSVDGIHDRPFVHPQGDEPFAFQHLKGFPHRRAADTQLGGDVRQAQFITAFVFSGIYGFAQDGRDFDPNRQQFQRFQSSTRFLYIVYRFYYKGLEIKNQ